MTNWLRRGLAFAVAMIVLRLIQGVMINTWEAQSALISVVLLIVYAAGVVVWAVRDGRDDASANPDPDRRRDLAMMWLAAGLSAGVISGFVVVLISLFDKALYAAGLFSELTVFAAFVALLVFLPAMVGVVVGRLLVDRGYAKVPQRHHGLAATDEEDRADTDVFAAVSVGAGAPAATEAGAVATAAAAGTGPVADWPTEEFPADTGDTHAATEEIPVDAAGTRADTEEFTAAIPAEISTEASGEDQAPDDERA